MSDLFNIYEDSLNTTIDRIKKIIETFTNLSKEKAEYAIQDANNCLKEADKILKQMEIECSAETKENKKNSNNANLTMKLRNYGNECEGIKKQFLKIQENYISQKSREALILGSENLSVGDTGGQQKHKLIDNEEMAWSQDAKLEQAKRIALGAERFSLEVMKNLNDQTHQMKDIKVMIGDMNENLDGSNSLLNKMMKSENRNKVILIGAGIILVLIIVFILLFKFI